MLLIITTNKNNGRHYWSTCNNDSIINSLDRSTSINADMAYLDVLKKYNGYVNLTVENGEVSDIECDKEAYAKYIASRENEMFLPEPTPYDEMAEAYVQGVNSI